MLTILSVAYPLAPVSPDAVGGAEQILSRLDRALVEAGHRSIVVACQGSRCAGTLVPVSQPAQLLDECAIAAAVDRHRQAVVAAQQRWRPDVIHLHGLDFSRYLPPIGPPVLITLHCPPDWYDVETLHPRRPNTWLNAVSTHQHRNLLPNPCLISPIDNGIPVHDFEASSEKDDYALVLGRIAPEKGIHIALDAARLADVRLHIAGELFPFPEHRRYWRDDILPRLDGDRLYLGPADFACKRRLLARARCLVLASLAEETSSLVAREAMASGTPVIAFRRGALVDVIEHGRTGYLVTDKAEMAAAMRNAGGLDHRACRATALARFSDAHMVQRYLDAYAALSRTRVLATTGRHDAL